MGEELSAVERRQAGALQRRLMIDNREWRLCNLLTFFSSLTPLTGADTAPCPTG